MLNEEHLVEARVADIVTLESGMLISEAAKPSSSAWFLIHSTWLRVTSHNTREHMHTIIYDGQAYRKVYGGMAITGCHIPDPKSKARLDKAVRDYLENANFDAT